MREAWVGYEAWVGLWCLGYEARVGLWSLGWPGVAWGVRFESGALSSVSCLRNEVVCCSCHELR